MMDPKQVLQDARADDSHAATVVAAARGRGGRPKGTKNAVARPAHAWSVSQLANWIGMSAEFVRNEIRSKEVKASNFGGVYRITIAEVDRYCLAKGWPSPNAETDARASA